MATKMNKTRTRNQKNKEQISLLNILRKFLLRTGKKEVMEAGPSKKLAKTARFQDENDEPVGISSGNLIIVFLHYSLKLTL